MLVLTKGFSVSQEWSLRVSGTQVQEPAGTRLQEGPSGDTSCAALRERRLCGASSAVQSRGVTAASARVAASCPGTLPTPSSCARPPCSRVPAPCGAGHSSRTASGPSEERPAPAPSGWSQAVTGLKETLTPSVK